MIIIPIINMLDDLVNAYKNNIALDNIINEYNNHAQLKCHAITRNNNIYIIFNDDPSFYVQINKNKWTVHNRRYIWE